MIGKKLKKGSIQGLRVRSNHYLIKLLLGLLSEKLKTRWSVGALSEFCFSTTSLRDPCKLLHDIPMF